jgi:hypothetical protein
MEPATADDLHGEMCDFHSNCLNRYKFNNRWDICMTILAIVLSIGTVAAGFTNRPIFTGTLGAAMSAIVTAQKAFPFGQRAAFYRLLIGQAEILMTQHAQHLLTPKEAVDRLSSLRMDFAQQLPRGSSAQAKPQEP